MTIVKLELCRPQLNAEVESLHSADDHTRSMDSRVRLPGYRDDCCGAWISRAVWLGDGAVSKRAIPGANLVAIQWFLL